MMYSLLVFAAVLVPPWDSGYGYYPHEKIVCEQRSEVRHFGDCMQGPHFLCWPLHRADGSIDSWWRFGPNNKPDESELLYVCGGRAGSCGKFDVDMDGDIDLHDFAGWTRHRYKGPPRPHAQRPASETWDGTYDNLPYVRRGVWLQKQRDELQREYDGHRYRPTKDR